MSHEAHEVVRHEGHEVHEESTQEGLRDLRGPKHRVLRGSSRGGAWPPLVELTRARIYEFVREPEAIFWAFVFPIAMVIALGIAFPSTGESPVVVGVERPADGERIRETLGHVQGIVVRDIAPDRVTQALRDGQVHVVVAPGNPPTYRFDPTRAESRLARLVVDEALKRAAGRRDPWEAREDRVEIAGSRYVDWLIPGLLGMDIMSSGLWGIGFSIVQARVRKLLKRMVASPMRKRDYLLAQLFARLVFLAGEVTVLVAFGILAFGMPVRGSFAAITVLSLVVLNDHIVNITSVAAAGFFIIGAQFVLNNFTAASYETGVRATAVGMELGVARVGAILGPFVAGALQQYYQSPTPMFLSIGISAITAGAIILLARRPANAPADSLEETAGLRKAAQPAS